MRFMNVAPARAWAGQISGRTNLGLNVQVLIDAFQSWIQGVEGESVGSVEHVSGTNTGGRNLPLLTARQINYTLATSGERY
jgi:hypothetical protein